MTGLHRRDVERLRRANPEEHQFEDLVTRIVSLWQIDKRFRTSDGKPRVLEFGKPSVGKSSAAFSRLVQSVSKELSPATVLFELERTNIVKKTEAGVELLRQSYSPSERIEHGFVLLSRDLRDLLQAVHENLERSNDVPNLHARTLFDSIRTENLEKVRKWVLEEGHRFHKKVREYLAAHDQDITPKKGYEGGLSTIAVTSFSCSAEEVNEDKAKE